MSSSLYDDDSGALHSLSNHPWTSFTTPTSCRQATSSRLSRSPPDVKFAEPTPTDLARMYALAWRKPSVQTLTSVQS